MPQWLRFVIAIGIPFVVVPSLSLSGFCLNTLGYLSDENAVDAVIDVVRSSGVHIVETPTGGYAQFVPDNQVRYISREEFRRANPECCKIVPHDRIWIGVWDQIWGRATKSVHVRYTVNYVNQYGSVTRMEAVAQRAVSNCGKVFERH